MGAIRGAAGDDADDAADSDCAENTQLAKKPKSMKKSALARFHAPDERVCLEGGWRGNAHRENVTQSRGPSGPRSEVRRM